MARISKAEHPRILQMVDEEHRKVPEVAAEYGCTPANIYALLAKLRRAKPQAEAEPGQVEAAVEAAAEPIVASVEPVDLFEAAAVEAPPKAASKRRSKTAPAIVPDAPALVLAVAEPVAPAAPPRPAPVSATVTDLPRRGAAKGGGLGASLAKPGFGLMMRTADGDENLTPFRSLEDLLSAVKPILRASARSPDAVWFSIQQIDLSALDSDAA
ncbi:hypothetical protein [Acidisphaera sp. L21]|uniref:hypothetical protein n=1 Tax=Acidisphaera sp. L21 TaxID=1641851 RepID=UPI00131D5C79|nr:hypothetical protein [Acidisphaera sp. L21]